MNDLEAFFLKTAGSNTKLLKNSNDVKLVRMIFYLICPGFQERVNWGQIMFLAQESSNGQTLTQLLSVHR